MYIALLSVHSEMCDHVAEFAKCVANIKICYTVVLIRDVQ